MIERYYREELSHLKEYAAEFAAAHPALAPMLAASSCDPDVERILEGVAFQNGLLRQKLDDDFPELINDLVRLVCPHYLRPIPSSTVVAFTPRPGFHQSHTIPAGAQLASVPVEGTRCLFRTCTAVELHPLEILDASLTHASDSCAITLSLALHDLRLSEWSPTSLRLYLAGEYGSASHLFYLLLRHLRRVVITSREGGSAVVLPPETLRPAGLDEEALLPYPSHAFTGYRLIQSYFAFPESFLFLDLAGWERWIDRGGGSAFSIRFELGSPREAVPPVKPESFALFAAPAVNLFPLFAQPVTLDHSRDRYLVRPDGIPPEHAQIYNIDKVTGFVRGASGERPYLPFDHFHHGGPEASYHPVITALTARAGYDLHLTFPDLPGEIPGQETLSIELTCTNGALPERLRLGDLCEGTSSSPESATFRNIARVTPSVVPPLGKNLLWRFISHLSLNRLSLASAETLRALLSLYIFEEPDQDQSALAANLKRVAGIQKVAALPADRLLRGMPLRGTEIRVEVDGSHFAGSGDLFLFGCVLDRFFASYTPLNTFTRLVIKDTARDETLEWPASLGGRVLL